jgi:geranylgeranyl diphosphate synthase type II
VANAVTREPPPQVSGERRLPGSARVSRSGFGVCRKVFESDWLIVFDKIVFGETPTTAHASSRALPGITICDRAMNFRVEHHASSIKNVISSHRVAAFGNVNLTLYLKSRQRMIDHALDRFLPKENAAPPTIHKAMRYSLFAGGKRLRPILCLAAAEGCKGRMRDALPLACAMECIHTYSLVHDDLPSMDNDDFRRGRATCHKVFGDGIAVLAGDALLTVAFEIAARAKPTRRYSMSEMFREISIAAGSRRLIAGQVADLEAEGKKVSRAELRYIHENKTAAMITTSVRLGAMSANADPKKLRAITKFGYALGLAFQVIDDILDVTQTSEKLGKSAGKDVAAQKATYPAVIGLEASRAEARRLTHAAQNALKIFGKEAEPLRELANYLLAREY